APNPPPPAAPPAAPPPAPAPNPPARPPAGPAGPPGAPADGGPFPTRDELTLAWADHVLAAMGRRAAVRFQVGRFVAATDGLATFALPNAVHRDRCEEVRGEAEAALAGHFGRRVPLRLVVDGEPPPPSSPTGEPPPPPDDDVDPTDLRDAPPGLASPLDHVMQAFQGAQVVEE
ncbi:MAG: hypothetical protein ABR511_12310, partial [Acidimicrobiales bacterium]